MTVFQQEFYGSSNLESAEYDDEERTLSITFRRTGETYTYQGVPPLAWQGLLGAPSPGRYFREFIKDRF